MNLILYYFSGTGNTKAIVSLFKQAVEDSGHSCEPVNIEDILKNKRDWPGHRDTMLGLAYPIHGGDTPDIVYDFISQMQAGSDNPVFILNTAADFIHFNDAAAKRILKRLAKKQYRVVYERTIVMGCNYVLSYPDAFNKQLYEAAKMKVRHMSEELLQGRRRLRTAGPVLKAIAALGHWGETFGARIYGRGLKSTDACTHCGKCVRECPVGNIRDENGKIHFNWHCIWCMRCVYACPEHAIKPRIMRFTVLKNGYDIDAIIRDNTLQGDFVNQNTKGFYKHFQRYISNPAI